MNYIRSLLIGAVLGAANVIPGVSGGTIAVAFGIYDKFLDLFSLNIKAIKKNIAFFICLATGMCAGILAFSKVISFLLESYAFAASFFFAGVVLGSIPMLLRRIKSDAAGAKIAFAAIGCAAGFALMLAIWLYDGTSAAALIGAEAGAKTFFILLLSGAITAFAMLIPGISGSFIMLAIGVYELVIRSVSELYLPILAPFAVGALAGLVGGARLIKLLLARFTSVTYGVILGLAAASALTLIPGIPHGAPAIISCVLALAAGILLSYFFNGKEAA